METSNDILSIGLIIVLSYLVYRESPVKLYPVVVISAIILYCFTKNIKKSLLYTLLGSYCLVILYKTTFPLEAMSNKDPEEDPESSDSDETEAGDYEEGEERELGSNANIEDKELDFTKKDVVEKLSQLKPILKKGLNLLNLI